SCLYFAFEEDGAVQLAGEFFARRRIPDQFFVDQPYRASEKAHPAHSRSFHTFDDVRVTEGRV
ncbi:MAG: hypothetical protein L7F78_15425, partial [Syntrophales bacterium LBB04]|nr:hypothetical protein [Syntrophales bacterium LBB04]